MEETRCVLAIGWQVVMSFFPGRRKNIGIGRGLLLLGADNWHYQQRNQKLNLFLLLMNGEADPRLKEAFDLWEHDLSQLILPLPF